MLKEAAISAGLVGLLGLVALPVEAAPPRKAPSAKAQLDFGVRMASRGLWSEAYFRFQQAERLDPNNPNVYNNLAVASEALGRFEEALSYYRKALEIDPTNKGVRRNYGRFVEFYQSFKPEGEEDLDTDEEESTSGDTA